MQFLDDRIPTRFWDKVSPCPMSGCWLWTGAANADEYGRFTISSPSGRRQPLVHRYVYEVEHGPVPDEMHCDHRCRVRACCNPAHIEIVTPLENWRRGVAPSRMAMQRDRCPRGHQFTSVRRGSDGAFKQRVCQTCTNLLRREARARARSAA